MLFGMKGCGVLDSAVVWSEGNRVRRLPWIWLILPQITVWLLSSHFETKERMWQSQQGGQKADAPVVSLRAAEPISSQKVGQSGAIGFWAKKGAKHHFVGNCELQQQKWHEYAHAAFLLSQPRQSDRRWGWECVVTRPAALAPQTPAQQLVSGLLSQPWPENTSACQDRFVVPAPTCILGPAPISELLTTPAATLSASPFKMQPQPWLCGVACSGSQHQRQDGPTSIKTSFLSPN